MSQDSSDTVYLYTTLESENRKLQSQQVKRINESLRAVRRLSRKSQQRLEIAAVTDEIEEVMATDSPGFYVESSVKIDRFSRDDDTGQFCLPDPDENVKFDKVLERAFDFIEKERSSFKSKPNSPVVKRWRLI